MNRYHVRLGLQTITRETATAVQWYAVEVITADNYRAAALQAQTHHAPAPVADQYLIVDCYPIPADYLGSAPARFVFKNDQPG